MRQEAVREESAPPDSPPLKTPCADPPRMI